MFRVPNFHNLLASIPSGSKLFTVIDLCSVFFSIPVEKARHQLFTFTWEDGQYTWLVILQGYTKNPTYLFQLIWLMCNFPNGSALFPYIDDLLPGLSSETAKEILSIYYNC